MSRNAAPAQARFLSGPIMGHVIRMTLTGAVGLMAVFLVDLADLYFLSMLGDTNVTAAIGFAGTLAFANLSICIGTGIAAAALVARNLGAGKFEVAKEMATANFMFSVLASAVYTLLIAVFAGPLLGLLGAQGEALRLARLFIWTLSPGFVCLAGALSCSFCLRGIGDAKRAMYITLSAAVTTLVLDPVFIFWFGWGIQGAAVANALADLAMLLLGLHGLSRVHGFLLAGNLKHLTALFKKHLAAIWRIAFPAMLTQLATPFAMAYSTAVVAPFGNDAVSASAIVGRLVPVAFSIIFSLTGAVGPIIGQNFGAGNLGRVKQTLREGIMFAFCYTLLVALVFFMLRHALADNFNATARTRELVVFFATYIALSWAFVGMQFVAAAAFNNLGKPSHSTWFNWGKSTLGTIPFAMIGAHYYGPEGVMAGTALGSVIFGIASVAVAIKLVGNLQKSIP